MQHRFKFKISNFEIFLRKQEKIFGSQGLMKAFYTLSAKTLFIKEEKTGFYENSIFTYMKDSIKDEKGKGGNRGVLRQKTESQKWGRVINTLLNRNGN